MRDTRVEDSEVDEDASLGGERCDAHGDGHEYGCHRVAVDDHHETEPQTGWNDESPEGGERSRLGGLADVAWVQVQADVQHQQNDAELADYRQSVIGLEKAKEWRPEDDAGDEFAKNRRIAEADGEPATGEGGQHDQQQVENVQTHRFSWH